MVDPTSSLPPSTATDQVHRSGSTARVIDAARGAGLTIEIRRMPSSTRTAEEAAHTCNCSPAQIVKSLIFERLDTHALVLLLIAGDQRADLTSIAGIVGSELVRADPKRVREETGFAIGGVAPIGHIRPLPVFMDESLFAHDVVWAAAGTPNTVFHANPKELCEAISATVLPACRR